MGVERDGDAAEVVLARRVQGVADDRTMAPVDAVVNVGTRPTFAGTTTTVEAHLLDASDRAEDLDLYGEQLTLRFLARLRDEQRFDGPDALVAQIHADIAAARTHFG
jgi:riboflavin kinase/FMN adenylyltransferase